MTLKRTDQISKTALARTAPDPDELTSAEQHLGIALADRIDRLALALAIAAGIDVEEPEQRARLLVRHRAKVVGLLVKQRTDGPATTDELNAFVKATAEESLLALIADRGMPTPTQTGDEHADHQ